MKFIDFNKWINLKAFQMISKCRIVYSYSLSFPDYETIGRFKHENKSCLMVKLHCDVPDGLIIPDDVQW